jgi:hypothetical protein
MDKQTIVNAIAFCFEKIIIDHIDFYFNCAYSNPEQFSTKDRKVLVVEALEIIVKKLKSKD